MFFQLSAPITFNQHQRKIQLPTSGMTDHAVGTIAGWGYRTNYVQRPAILLNKISVEILLATTCQKYMGNQLYFEQLCGIYFQGQGTCNVSQIDLKEDKSFSF